MGHGYHRDYGQQKHASRRYLYGSCAGFFLTARRAERSVDMVLKDGRSVPRSTRTLQADREGIAWPWVCCSRLAEVVEGSLQGERWRLTLAFWSGSVRLVDQMYRYEVDHQMHS